VETRSLRDGSGFFDVTACNVERPCRIVLFAVGGGGNPERHAPLLAALAEHGCCVVAPHHERLVSPFPTEEQLVLRARRLTLALDSIARPGVPVIGVGHSIGAALLLALSGGKLWLHRSAPVPIARDQRLDRLALLSPATGFFRAPAALDDLRTPLLIWAGGNDTITPPAHAELLKDLLGERTAVSLRLLPEAGHFSFMHVLPPTVSDPLADRDSILADLTAAICEFVLR
jgi:fermentation-respiration switch protein FrsA (DUF1100 family)